MWWKDYAPLVSNATIRKSEVAVALLYAHAARLNELISFLTRQVDLVGAVELNFTYQYWGGLTSADFVPTIPLDRLRKMREERGRRTLERLREAIDRMDPSD